MEALDIREKGGLRGGEQQTSDRRLFMQFLAFNGASDTAKLTDALSRSGLESVLYEDANDPRGVGLLTWSDDPNFFVNFKGERPHQTRLEGGDASSDSFCYP